MHTNFYIVMKSGGRQYTCASNIDTSAVYKYKMKNIFTFNWSCVEKFLGAGIWDLEKRKILQWTTKLECNIISTKMSKRARKQHFWGQLRVVDHGHEKLWHLSCLKEDLAPEYLLARLIKLGFNINIRHFVIGLFSKFYWHKLQDHISQHLSQYTPSVHTLSRLNQVHNYWVNLNIMINTWCATETKQVLFSFSPLDGTVALQQNSSIPSPSHPGRINWAVMDLNLNCIKKDYKGFFLK